MAYSYDPQLALPADQLGLNDPFDHLRQEYARRAPSFLAEALPGLSPDQVRFVPHHVAHAASAGLASPYRDCAVLVLDGRGECASHLAGHYRDGELSPLGTQPLPASLGLFYEDLTEHLGFLRSSDEFKVMALASYGTPRSAERLREYVHGDGEGGFRTRPVPWAEFAPRRAPGEPWRQEHADLAASAQLRLEEVLLELVHRLHERTGERTLAMAGGVALNCVANSRLRQESPFDEVWVQPAAGDAGTALGAALHVASAKDAVEPMPGPALGRGWDEEELRAVLERARLPYERPPSIAAAVAEALAGDAVVGWFQGRSEYGPRALGHRSLLAHPGREANLDRLNAVKGREEFRPVAPMLLAERAPEILEGPLPSPYMLFVQNVREEWRSRIPAVVHVDGTARAQTVTPEEEPLVAELLGEFERRTGLPVLVNTSFNTAGRPMVDTPAEALECFGSAPIDLLALGPFAVRRAEAFR